MGPSSNDNIADILAFNRFHRGYVVEQIPRHGLDLDLVGHAVVLQGYNYSFTDETFTIV